MPLLPATLAWLEYAVHAMYPGGDHIIVVIVVGSVERDSEDLQDARPLQHFNREYGTLCRMRRHEVDP